MRWWTMADGRALVEGPAEERILEGVAVSGAHTYYLFRADDTLEREYQGYNGAIDEYLYVGAYFVRDGALHDYYRQVHDSGREEQSGGIRLPGLTPADPAETERCARLKAAIDAYVRKHARGTHVIREGGSAGPRARSGRGRRRPGPGA